MLERVVIEAGLRTRLKGLERRGVLVHRRVVEALSAAALPGALRKERRGGSEEALGINEAWWGLHVASDCVEDGKGQGRTLTLSNMHDDAGAHPNRSRLQAVISSEHVVSTHQVSMPERQWVRVL